MKKILSIVVFFTTSLISFANQPDWVVSFGVNTPYPSETHLSGFAMVNISDPEPLVKSRQYALSDLTGKIETKVYSDITLKETDGSEGFNSSASLITRCTVDITVSGVNFEYYEDNRNLYSLAYISIEKLSNYYTDKANNLYRNIIDSQNKGKEYIKNNRDDLALSELYKAKNNIFNFYEQLSLYNSVNPGESADFYQKIINLDDITSFKNIENDINDLLEDIEDLDSKNINEALNKAALILQRQNISAGNIEVPPFNFEQTSYSSDFGRYGSSLLESVLINNLSAQREKTIFRSNYWLLNNIIHLSILAMDHQGVKLGQAIVRFPYDTQLKNYNYQPQNFEESMISLKEFSEGALTDGGINIDIWTNKGRDEDASIYEVGETLQLYMRVNQPAFLQITYHLATGQNVLLERSYYIGMDKVNRAIKLPYDFEVQPPLGIEQLVVTAFSIEPPEPYVVDLN